MATDVARASDDEASGLGESIADLTAGPTATASPVRPDLGPVTHAQRATRHYGPLTARPHDDGAFTPNARLAAGARSRS
jgi:hypothetical protein